MSETAILALADGTVFYGWAVGAKGQMVGEVVFHTGMTGYQEVLTDPSYSDQIITFTTPHIGNTGVNSEDEESKAIWAKGVIIKSLTQQPSNWRQQQSLHDYLIAHQCVGVAEIDTRQLTHVLRSKGAQSGCIMTGDQVDEAQAIAAAKNFPGLIGKSLVSQVTTTSSYTWTEGNLPWVQESNELVQQSHRLSRHVVVYDFGVKRSILRLLVDRGCQVTVVPATTSVADVLALKPQGILLSNGPGDPAACTELIQQTQQLTEVGIPLFGICLGFQILALACGAKTEKLKFGHHGANHPVQCLNTKRVMITSQNHGFAVAAESLPEYFEITHISLFDQTLQGIQHREKPIFGFQGHPEAGPGPADAGILFDHFMELMQ